MAFVVEDGTGLSTSNSYVTVTQSDTYFSERGNDDWAGSDDVKQGALMYASMLVDTMYRWNGTILEEDQAMAWPRTDFYDNEGRLVTGIPQKIKNAVCELALEHILNGLNDPSREGIKSESFGNSSTTYVSSSKSFSFVKKMLVGMGSSRSSIYETFRA